MIKNDFQLSLDQVVDWINSYRREVESLPVLSPLDPGDVLRQLPKDPPSEAESFARIFDDFRSIVVPGITHWQHPRFFGYFPSNVSPPSVLAEMLVAAMGVQCMSWSTSPAATELEIRMMQWLRDLFGLPADFSGVIQDSASNSTLAAMIVAREQASGFATNDEGLANQRLVAYCSTEAHSSIEKAAKVCGLGARNLRKIPVNENQEMRSDLLEKAIVEDVSSGRHPFFVVGAFGTTSTTAVDPLDRIQQIASRYGLWFHVDAAYAGSALILPEVRSLARGIEKADSVVINPHKWLMTNFDCSAFFIRHPDDLVRAFTILPEYLKTSESEAVVNFRDWGLGLGRRFRSLKLWFVLRWYGVEGLRSILRRHVELASELEETIASHPAFEIMARRHFNLVCFRLRGADELNQSLLRDLNASGKLFLTHTRVNDRYALRMVVGQTNVTAEHLRASWAEILRIAEGLLQERPLIADRSADLGQEGMAARH